MEVLLKFAGEKKTEFIFCVLLAAIGSILGIVPYALIYYIIEYFLNARTEATPVFQMIGIGFGVIVLKYILVISSFVFSHIAAFDLLYSIRTRLTRHLGTLPMGYWSRHNSGNVRKILQSDVESLENFMAHHIPDIISGLVLPIATLIFLFFVDWRLALCTLIPLPIGIFMMMKMMGMGKETKRKQNMREYHNSLEAMHSSTVEFVQGMPVVKAFNIVVDSFKKLKRSLEKYKEFVLRLSREQSKYWALFTSIVLGGGIFIIPMGIYLIHTGQTDPATVILFLLLGNGCFVGFVNFISITGHIEIVSEGAIRIQRVLEEKSLSEPKAPRIPAENSITLTDVGFRYNEDGPAVLKNISEEFPSGSFTAIVGPSGAGKTTMVHLMARMWDVTDGTISIEGISLPEIGTAGINATVGTVFQDVQMLTDTVRNNICMGLNDVSMQQIEEAARTAACYDFIMDLPQVWDTVIGEGGKVHLSGGEKQRIALARVVLKNPPVILLDEASSYADADSEKKMQEAFSRVTAGKTVVVIAHRLSTIVNADKILVVDKGEIQERGTHNELLEQEGLYKRMWKAHTHARHWNMSSKERV
jgi:ATP-binding cassette, subfamily B, bacterial IrtA/YbtP